MIVIQNERIIELMENSTLKIDLKQSKNMVEKLSSHLTLFYKIILPVIWISSFGVSTLNMFLTADRSPNNPRWFFLLMWIVGSAFIGWNGFRLKEVRIDSQFLHVSNYWKEIHIPIKDISDVTENVLINTHPVKIHLKSPSDFGSKVVFMPTMRISFFSSHPVVSKLKDLIK